MEASSAAWWRRASSRKSEIMALAAWFGMREPCGRTAPVFGDLGARHAQINKVVLGDDLERLGVELLAHLCGHAVEPTSPL